MIVLDLAGVGVDAGVSTVPLCRRLHRSFPQLRLITGGGVRSVDDLRELQGLGIEGVLAASALHNGTIGRRELEQLAAERAIRRGVAETRGREDGVKEP